MRVANRFELFEEFGTGIERIGGRSLLFPDRDATRCQQRDCAFVEEFRCFDPIRVRNQRGHDNWLHLRERGRREALIEGAVDGQSDRSASAVVHDRRVAGSDRVEGYPAGRRFTDGTEFDPSHDDGRGRLTDIADLPCVVAIEPDVACHRAGKAAADELIAIRNGRDAIGHRGYDVGGRRRLGVRQDLDDRHVGRNVDVNFFGGAPLDDASIERSIKEDERCRRDEKSADARDDLFALVGRLGADRFEDHRVRLGVSATERSRHAPGLAPIGAGQIIDGTGIGDRPHGHRDRVFGRFGWRRRSRCTGRWVRRLYASEFERGRQELILGSARQIGPVGFLETNGRIAASGERACAREHRDSFQRTHIPAPCSLVDLYDSSKSAFFIAPTIQIHQTDGVEKQIEQPLAAMQQR